jgi:H+/Cl- antiporter ClcA
VYTAVRFLASVLDTNLMLPSGDFNCLFAVGAGLGRLFGTCMTLAFPGESSHHHQSCLLVVMARVLSPKS